MNTFAIIILVDDGELILLEIFKGNLLAELILFY